MMALLLHMLLVGTMGICIANADSTIQNLSRVPIFRVNDVIVPPGQVTTVSIPSNRSGAAYISVTGIIRTVTNIRILTNKTYFAVPTPFANLTIIDGLALPTLDLVDTSIVESAF